LRFEENHESRRHDESSDREKPPQHERHTPPTIMTCLNCTRQILNVFIHGPSHNALRNSLPRVAPLHQLRRNSSYVTNYDQMQVATDDDYIPFVGLPPMADNNSQLSASQERVTHKPPPPSIFGSSEPEIRLRVEEDATEDFSARKHEETREATPEIVDHKPAPLAVKYAHRNVRNKRSEVFDLLLKKKAAAAKDKTKVIEKTGKYEKIENSEKVQNSKHNEVKAAASTRLKTPMSR
ncbi:hypothetical protein BZA77DRAFT_369314, partial [Pyronema omphalodes]